MSKQQKPYVVVVDDELVIAETLAFILNESGFSATAFTDLLMALESARTSPTTLLISDVVMPDVSVAAAHLQSQRLIKYIRGKLQILDRPALEHHSCECYHVVKNHRD